MYVYIHTHSLPTLLSATTTEGRKTRIIHLQLMDSGEIQRGRLQRTSGKCKMGIGEGVVLKLRTFPDGGGGGLRKFGRPKISEKIKISQSSLKLKYIEIPI